MSHGFGMRKQPASCSRRNTARRAFRSDIRLLLRRGRRSGSCFAPPYYASGLTRLLRMTHLRRPARHHHLYCRPPMQDIRVASVQMESAAGDKAANFAKIERFAAEAAARRARIVLFPECCLTGYWFLRNLTVAQLGELAERVPDGPACRRLLGVAARHGVSIGAGLVEAASDSAF